MPTQSRIRIPELSDPHARMIRACGAINTEDKALLSKMKRLAKSDDYVTKIGRGKNDCYAVLFGGAETRRGLHIHVDIARPSYFGDDPPKVTHTRSDLEEVLGWFAGLEVKVGINARYLAKSSEIPEKSFVRISMVRAMRDESDEVQIVQNGASFAFKNAPVDAINWFVTRVGKPEEKTRVELIATRTLKLNDKYLPRIFAEMDASFVGLVLTGAPEHAESENSSA